MTLRTGRRNLLTDVDGLLVGHATDVSAETGATVILCKEHYCAGVDVRGGGPGTREIDVLSPENLVGRAHGFAFAGGSVFGLAAADGVLEFLAEQGVGYRHRPEGLAVPIVPAAVIYDLANGGDKNWRTPPYRDLGFEAAKAGAADFALGRVGAGRGGQAGLLWGGVGSASIDLGAGIVVAALAVNNAIGSTMMPDGKTPWAQPYEIGDEFGGVEPGARTPLNDPLPPDSKLGAGLRPGANTTIGIVAVNADLSTAECKRMAMMAHDGLARAVRPAHSPFDGDTIFAVATATISIGDGPMRAVALARIGSAAADCFARAVARGVYAARLAS